MGQFMHNKFPKLYGFFITKTTFIYALTVLPVLAFSSLGMGSNHLLYRIVFPITVLLFVIKLLVSDLSKSQWWLMIISGALLLINLLLNGEKTLILGFIAIMASQDICKDTILKLALYLKLICVSGTILCACFGLIPNWSFLQMKEISGTWQMVETYCFGYPVPNQCYMHLFVLALLVLFVYHRRLQLLPRLILYSALTGILYYAYTVILCRTGWFLWLGTMFLYICFDILTYVKSHKVGHIFYQLFFYGLAAIPFLVLIFTFICVAFYVPGYHPDNFAWRINEIMTGRIANIYNEMPGILTHLVGASDSTFFDNALIHTMNNYGLLILGLILWLYVMSILRYIKREQPESIMPLAIMMIYGLGEMIILSSAMNIFIILLSVAVFCEDQKKLQ